MANILISYYSDYGEAMYDAITGFLLKNGNNIFRFNINNSAVSITGWGGKSYIVDKNILEKIKKFHPDIVLNFNNSLPQNCYNVLAKKCKICAIDADAPELAFWNKEMIVKHQNRFVYLGLQSYSKTMYERYLNSKLDEKKYLYFPPATIVQNIPMKQDKNISFIGSNFYPLAVPEGLDFYTEDGLKLYEAFKKNYYLTLDEAKEICKNSSNVEWMFGNVGGYYVGQERLKYMQQLTDLGFTFYGVRGWERIACYDYELAKCFDPTPKVTIEENQWVYNTSKIAINMSHPLAKSSFSWRVMDIMASGACLLMEDKPDWRDLFEKYLSKDVLELIIYKDRFDMREKAKELLANEALRQKCVKELNNAIEQNGRWECRFKSLEQFLNIPMLNLGKNGNLFMIDIEDKSDSEVTQIPESTQNTESTQNLDPTQNSEPIQKSLCVKRSLIQRLNFKKRIKLTWYLLCLLYAQIPVFDIFICKEIRLKWKNKIEKYWR